MKELTGCRLWVTYSYSSVRNRSTERTERQGEIKQVQGLTALADLAREKAEGRCAKIRRSDGNTRSFSHSEQEGHRKARRNDFTTMLWSRCRPFASASDPALEVVEVVELKSDE